MPIEFRHAPLWRFVLGVTLIVGVLLGILISIISSNPEVLVLDFDNLNDRRRGDRYILPVAIAGLPFCLVMLALRIRVNEQPYFQITDDVLVIRSLFLRRSIPRNQIQSVDVIRKSRRFGVYLCIECDEKQRISKWEWLLLTYSFGTPVKGCSPVIWDVYFDGDASTFASALSKPPCPHLEY